MIFCQEVPMDIDTKNSLQSSVKELPRRTTRAFVGWLKWLLPLAVATVAFVTYSRARVAAIIEHNTTEVLFWAAELRTEAGSNPTNDARMYIRLLDTSLQRMENRYPARYLAVTAPEFVPNDVFTEAKKLIARGCTNKVEALDGFRKASDLFYSTGQRWLSAQKDAWYARFIPGAAKHGVAATELQSFTNAVVAFRNEPNPTLETAEKLCWQSRLTTASIVSLWYDNAHPEYRAEVKTFTESLRDLSLAISQLSQSEKLSDSEREQTKKFAKSIERREKTVSALSSGKLRDAQKDAQKVLLSCKDKH